MPEKPHGATGPRRRPALLQGVLEDLAALPTHELRTIAMNLLMEIEAGAVTGKPLEDHGRTGDLSDCFKVYFDHPHGDRPAYRLVYRLNPDQSVAAAHIQAIVIGKREALAVYREAARRLRRV